MQQVHELAHTLNRLPHSEHSKQRGLEAAPDDDVIDDVGWWWLVGGCGLRRQLVDEAESARLRGRTSTERDV